METDFLIIGAGVAGLRAAIEAAGGGRVLVLTKDRLTESASEYAQGGIAVALSDDDKVELHVELRDKAMTGRVGQQAPIFLFEKVGEKFDVASFQILKEFEGKRGFSLAQGQ